MKYGEELIRELEAEIERYENQMSRRWDRINNGETDQEDCFVSMRVEERGRDLARDKIKLIQNGGFDWFVEYATLDGVLVNAKWCQCRSFTGYGKTSKLRVEMPDGTVKWTQAATEKGLARIGIKRVLCKRPARNRETQKTHANCGSGSKSWSSKTETLQKICQSRETQRWSRKKNTTKKL